MCHDMCVEVSEQRHGSVLPSTFMWVQGIELVSQASVVGTFGY